MTETLRRGYPGMKSVKDMPVLQDGPPPGGFPSVRYARRIPSTGPTGFTLFAVGAAVMAFGFYRVGEFNKYRRALKAEKMAMRAAIYPVLQAEEDRRWVQAKKQAVENEAKIMKDVPGWKAGQNVYLTGRWVPPAQPVGAWGE
ncbi:NADH dehydrogenase [ubiquinone] 1 alpha subcomplex subunit [Coccomyxa sp. Obi]|nr:NADH dehydrogenase [ubiquinone] 1 alpha subcomplex subunit [Coccomyxa sp. Obi]